MFGRFPRWLRTTKQPYNLDGSRVAQERLVCADVVEANDTVMEERRFFTCHFGILPVKAVCYANWSATHFFVIPYLGPSRSSGGSTARASSQDTSFGHGSVKLL